MSGKVSGKPPDTFTPSGTAKPVKVSGGLSTPLSRHPRKYRKVSGKSSKNIFRGKSSLTFEKIMQGVGWLTRHLYNVYDGETYKVSGSIKLLDRRVKNG